MSPEVNIHLPVAAVVRSIVELELESAPVPNMVITLWNRNYVLGETVDDPRRSTASITVPHHAAALFESRAHHVDPLMDHAVCASTGNRHGREERVYS